jgi:hypothetical protein
MTTSRLAIAGALGLWILPAALVAQSVELPIPRPDQPPGHAVLLPPQTVDGSAKAPNHTRERTGEWTIAGGIYYMQPVFDTNPAFVVNSAAGNITRQATFGHHLEVSPNVWLGYVSERGWGVRGRWFQYDHDTEARYTAAPGESIIGISNLTLGRLPVAGAVAASSSLTVNVVDFQATCSYESARWSHLLGFGVRYSYLNQDYRATLADAGTRIDLTSGHNFNGVGPSLSLESKFRIKESGFAIYGQAHGAILFGHGNELSTAVNNGVPQQFARDEMRVLPVGELEVGAEYQRNVGKAKVFLQSGFVGQVWWGGGNASNLDALGLGSASHSNFGFVGIALRAGVRY